MLFPITNRDVPMSAATTIHKVAIPMVARTRNSALVSRETVRMESTQFVPHENAFVCLQGLSIHR
jgi:hypothetical protein